MLGDSLVNYTALIYLGAAQHERLIIIGPINPRN